MAEIVALNPDHSRLQSRWIYLKYSLIFTAAWANATAFNSPTSNLLRYLKDSFDLSVLQELNIQRWNDGVWWSSHFSVLKCVIVVLWVTLLALKAPPLRKSVFFFICFKLIFTVVWAIQLSFTFSHQKVRSRHLLRPGFIGILRPISKMNDRNLRHFIHARYHNQLHKKYQLGLIKCYIQYLSSTD